MAELDNTVTFESFGFHPDLLKGIQELGFRSPTPIQARAIPHIMQGKDLIGCAQTGTGKTAAFVLPILDRLMRKPSGPNVRAMIVAPTRELALQIMEHLKSLSRYVHLKGEAIFGGAPMQHQIAALERGVDIISATPGRLLDHVFSGRIEFKDLEVLVLDEADRMLDMGFLPDIHQIICLLPTQRQSLMFSATMPAEILKLTHEMLKNPVTVQIDAKPIAAVGIRQAVYPVASDRKTDLLLKLLRGEELVSVIVFVRTKRSADEVARNLIRRGVQASVIHSDRSQDQRLFALERFRAGKSQVMVATDIAARGIDIDEISHVINYDVPHQPEDYIHRIGRTARAEATGDAFTLMSPAETELIQDIEKTLGHPLPRVNLPDFDGSFQAELPRGSRRSGPASSGRRSGSGRPRGRTAHPSGGASRRSHGGPQRRRRG
ncbi:MAG: hypothetical protein COV76_03790 [Candidatus Omnitrophica bacterium CG11_big_fil_rev_8_21_14_0_20_64_10]|nr:MAG: hypothetical protein COV76_03790 [Candidatus Omnitrophica bacterium CG11_big_fil_rev_8_21_14_0_20_64_10]